MGFVNEKFKNELSKWQDNTDLVAGILQAVGISWEDLTESNESDGVQGFYLYPSDLVFTAWVVKNNLIVLHERNLEGLTLTISFPISRIRRISEQNDRNFLNVTLEFDADRTVFTGVASQSDDGSLSLSGNSLHSGYVLVASLTDSIAFTSLMTFITSLKNLLN
jgi:hypothetical protein